MPHVTELGLSGVPRVNRDETFAGKALFIAPVGLTSLGLWGGPVTGVDNSAFGIDAFGIFPVHLYLASTEVIGR